MGSVWACVARFCSLKGGCALGRAVEVVELFCAHTEVASVTFPGEENVLVGSVWARVARFCSLKGVCPLGRAVEVVE